MKNKNLINALMVLTLVVILVSCTATQTKKMSEQKYKKVLVIGIDGMDPKIVSKLMDEGKLPNLKKLSETGTFTNLNTSYPPHSPVAWASIATGTNPGKHNIFDFIRRNPSNYLPELSLTKQSGTSYFGTDYESYITSEPFWRITSESKIPTTIIRWPVTFPPEKVQGNMLSGLGVPDIKGLLSGYTLYTSAENVSQKTSNKIVKVTIQDNVVDTEISGPRTRKSGELVDIKAPMKISLSDDSAELDVQGKKHIVKVGEWSDWIQVKFKISLFNSVHGICRAHLISTDPFEIYLTTIQIDPENPISDISYPKQYSSDLAKKIGLYYTLGMPEETDGFVEDKLSVNAFGQQIHQIETERDKMFWEEFEKFQKTETGVYAFVYDSSDRVQHVFWDYKLLGNDSSELVVNETVVHYLEQKDKFVGEIIEKIDENTLLMVISDHGFTSFERSVSMNTWLVDNGFMTLTKELDENEEGALFRYVDWSKTKAYAVGFNSIYINLKDREAKGIVEDREKVMNEIISKLEGLNDDKFDKNVINKAYKREEIYHGDQIEQGPDIVVGFNPGYRMSWQTAIGGFTKEVLMDNNKKWDGDHLVDPKFVPGVLFSNVKLNVDSASQIDVAPTVLDALGMDVPEKMDGESLLK